MSPLDGINGARPAFIGPGKRSTVATARPRLVASCLRLAASCAFELFGLGEVVLPNAQRLAAKMPGPPQLSLVSQARHVSPPSGVKQTWISAVLMSLIDPFATSARICAVLQS